MYNPNSVALLQTVATSSMPLQRSTAALIVVAVGRGNGCATLSTRWRAIASPLHVNDKAVALRMGGSC